MRRLHDPDAINYVAYDPAEVFYDDGSCIAAVPGAMPRPHATTTLKPTPTTEAASSKTPWACAVAYLADEDEDGICDDIDECVGELDECGSATALDRVFLRV